MNIVEKAKRLVSEYESMPINYEDSEMYKTWKALILLAEDREQLRKASDKAKHYIVCYGGCTPSRLCRPCRTAAELLSAVEQSDAVSAELEKL